MGEARRPSQLMHAQLWVCAFMAFSLRARHLLYALQTRETAGSEQEVERDGSVYDIGRLTLVEGLHGLGRCSSLAIPCFSPFLTLFRVGLCSLNPAHTSPKIAGASLELGRGPLRGVTAGGRNLAPFRNQGLGYAVETEAQDFLRPQ